MLQEACAFISSSQVAIGARSGKIHGLLFACRSLLQLREATQVPFDDCICDAILMNTHNFVIAGHRCRPVCAAGERRFQVPLMFPHLDIRISKLTRTCSNLWGVFRDWWRHHGPLFSLSGENAFYQLWQQAVPRVTMVTAARAQHSLLHCSFRAQVEDDARRSVDAQLKAACECLIFDVSHQLSAPVMMLHAQLESSAPPPLDAEAVSLALTGVLFVQALRYSSLFCVCSDT